MVLVKLKKGGPPNFGNKCGSLQASRASIHMRWVWGVGGLLEKTSRLAFFGLRVETVWILALERTFTLYMMILNVVIGISTR